MYCNNCGKEIDGNSRFCSACGTPITSNNTLKTSQNDSNAVWESKGVQVHPDDENSTIELYEVFGWELKSSQTIDKQDSHLENDFGVIKSVTEYEKYVKLTFRRNKNMPSYAELCELERQYHSFDFLSEPNEPSVLLLVGGILSALVGILPGLQGFLLIGIILLIVYSSKKKKYNKLYNEYTEEKERANEIKYNCIAEAEKLH